MKKAALFAAAMILVVAPGFAPAQDPASDVDSEAVARGKAIEEANRKEIAGLRLKLAKDADGGDREAMTKLAALIEQDKEATPADLATALDLYEKAANKGENYARERICRAYLLGDGRPVDANTGGKHCDALPNKDPVSLFWVGYDYENGVTGARDEAGAIHFYIEAAKAGSGDAAAALGRMALAKDQVSDARQWFKHGVYLGSADAMDRMAVMLEAGQGGDANAEEAAWLFREAARRGNSHAIERVRTLPPYVPPKVPMNIWGGKTQKPTPMTHTYSDGKGTHTETLNISTISKLLESYFPELPSDDKQGRATIDCFVDTAHRIDACVLTQEYPPGYLLGRIVEAFFRDGVTVAETDSAGNPTANHRFKLTVHWISS